MRTCRGRKRNYDVLSAMENMKRFNTTGPCFPDEHYMLPALDRLPGIRELVAGGNYFVVHAPRQTGKTIHVIGL